ncbi:Sec-independent protein translocase TatA [Pseudomonas sp. SG-MS2]|uniref:twin-arginine translocase TatA/TatE family subunit n=1 Tax=Pseudomonas TaxID=286 RepID=UPI000CFD3F68|nr:MULTISPECIES: twin-arginine translocase TatA/TatE family subunit [unclassified Pseudomonas]KAF1311078.1 Sec-independent protein translocase TatA [Pseudomonas sp. SG-MS2]PRA59442.1 twin-arginine translocase TatA/TatE family subunit [Pseudomonas sp. MYb187]
MGIFDWKHWIVLLLVVVLVFGTKKLKNLGGDLGESLKGFRKAMSDEDQRSDVPVSASVHSKPYAPGISSRQESTVDGLAQAVNESHHKG